MNSGIPHGRADGYTPAVPTRRLAEAGIDPRAGWAFIHNPEAFVARPNLTIPTNVLKITANVPLVGLREYAIPIQVADGWLFDRRWNGYLFAAAGLIRHLDLDGDRYSAPAPGPDHSLRLFGALRLIGGPPVLAIAPWWEIAYIPKPGGGEPPLTPQLRWWPGAGGGMALSFRDNLERDQSPTKANLDAAIAARRLLLMVQQQMKQTGRPSKDEAAIRSTLDPVVKSLRAKGLEPTEERVAEHLPRKRGRARDPRVIRRWVNDVLRVAWSDYIGSVR